MRFHEGGPEGALAERYAAILRGIYPPPWLRGMRPVAYDRHG